MRCIAAWVAVVCFAAPGIVAGEDADPTQAHRPDESRWSAKSNNGLFQVSVQPRTGQVTIGTFQVWDMRVEDADGNVVFPARFAIGGGMQGHGHGLPTQPRVTNFLPDGRYVIEGMKFNMAGDWTLYLAIESAAGIDQVQIDIAVDY